MNKLLVITGGSKGIGLATCRSFLQHGYRVISLSRSSPPKTDVAHLPVDLCDVEWPRTLGPQLLEQVRGADRIALVHNAAMTASDTVADLASSDLARVLHLNVTSAVQLNGMLLPLMEPGSSILYVGSTLSEKAVPGACSYVVSKHAQLGLMRATCQDLMGRGIHTAAVCPGFTDTEMLRAHVGHYQQTLQSIAGMSSFGRLVQPEEIADTLQFCAENPVINGAVLHANLGQREN